MNAMGSVIMNRWEVKKTRHLYISCLGEFYSTDEPQSVDDLYCGKCGDTDWYIGTYETEVERERLEKEYMED